MPADSYRGRLHGEVFGTSFEKGFEDSLKFVEVVVYDVDKERGVHNIGYQFPRRRVRLIHLGPLLSEFESLILEQSKLLRRDLRETSGGHTFHAMKLTASTIVGWIISLPGKTPQVTALGPSECVFVRRSPRLLIT